MVFSCPAGAFFHGKRMLKQQQGSRRQAAVSKRGGSRQEAGREHLRAETYAALCRVSERTLGLLDCHCNALFRPSVPWCFPVRQVRFFSWQKDAEAAARKQAAGSSEQARGQQAGGRPPPPPPPPAAAAVESKS